MAAPPVAPARPPGSVAQLRTLIARYTSTKLRDRSGLWVLGAQPAFLAVVMAVVFPKPTSSMLFMLSLSCLWFGMSGAVRELITDRVVWRRERRVGVGVAAGAHPLRAGSRGPGAVHVARGRGRRYSRQLDGVLPRRQARSVAARGGHAEPA